MSTLDDKINEHFAGFVVRKDLVKAVKVSDFHETRKFIDKTLADVETVSGGKAYWFRMDENGELVDPFNGRQDLAAGILRHVGEAFVEDPVRILRIARFAARFGFTVAEDTQKLMRFMVDDGEVDHLVPERVWQELSKGLMEAQPSRFFTVLRDCVPYPTTTTSSSTASYSSSTTSMADLVPMRSSRSA